MFCVSLGLSALLTSAVWGCQASLKAVLAKERVSNRSQQPDSPTCSGKVVFVGEQLTEGMLFPHPLPLKMDLPLTLLFSEMPAAIAHLWQAIRKPSGLPPRCCSHLAEEKYLQGGSAAAPHKSQRRLRDKSRAESRRQRAGKDNRSPALGGLRHGLCHAAGRVHLGAAVIRFLIDAGTACGNAIAAWFISAGCIRSVLQEATSAAQPAQPEGCCREGENVTPEPPRALGLSFGCCAAASLCSLLFPVFPAHTTC